MESPLGSLGHSSSHHEAGADWNKSQLLEGQGSFVTEPDGKRHSGILWKKSCIPITSDPKILGVLGGLLNGESSGDRETVCRVQAQGGKEPQPQVGRLPVSLFSTEFTPKVRIALSSSMKN